MLILLFFYPFGTQKSYKTTFFSCFICTSSGFVVLLLRHPKRNARLMKRLMPHFILIWMLLCLPLGLAAQTIDGPTALFLMHSSGNHLAKGSDGGGILESPDVASPQALTFIPDGEGYYALQSADGRGYLSLDGEWNTLFVADASSDKAKYAMESAGNSFIRLRCKFNGKYLGTDATTPSSKVYSDKDGQDTRHLWFLATDARQTPPADTARYAVNPAVVRQHFEGWGISLCWWANMCGRWSDEKIDELVDWLVSPEGLNYRIFRYNIGGGDDPQNRNCTPHHMGASGGKGLRAEMEGFKDSPDGGYIWERDTAQRKIMLKIKEKRPDAIFEAFSNSCPYYMTFSGCCAGNSNAGADNLRPECYEDFARYLVDVCLHYKEEYGIEFRTLSPFNEPMTNYWGANGGQEGCHFDVASQIAFLKVLHPILESSGLNTVISASEETDAAQSVRDFEAYRDAGVLPLLGQWNTHTYSATIPARSQISALCEEEGVRLWMSEVGLGGSGIAGNLELAQKLMDDIRYIMPVAWVDWQYVEEGNDQWCLVQGDFANQTYHKVKNYFIRQHFSKFILPGYTFLTSLNGQTLAARNPGGDSLVVVAINPTALATVHQADLTFYQSANSVLTAVRTSETEEMAPTSDYTLQDGRLTYRLPPYSIVTFVIGVEEKPDADNSIAPGHSYWILPRNATDQALQAEGGSVSLQPVGCSPAQIWELTSADDGYVFTNRNGEILTDRSPAYALGHSSNVQDGQVFLITPIDPLFCKITTTDGSKAFDLEGEHYTAGTQIGLWEYGSSPTATHRQWLFMRLPETDRPDAIPLLLTGEDNAASPIRLTRESGSILRIDRQTSAPCPVSIHTPSGLCIYRTYMETTTLRIPLRKGVYIISTQTPQARFNQTVCL